MFHIKQKLIVGLKSVGGLFVKSPLFYITLLTIQIVSKHLTVLNRRIVSVMYNDKCISV